MESLFIFKMDGQVLYYYFKRMMCYFFFKYSTFIITFKPNLTKRAEPLFKANILSQQVPKLIREFDKKWSSPEQNSIWW